MTFLLGSSHIGNQWALKISKQKRTITFFYMNSKTMNVKNFFFSKATVIDEKEKSAVEKNLIEEKQKEQ